MCRRSDWCFLLGRDPSKWSSQAPRFPPEWFRTEALTFREAVQAAADGNKSRAVEVLSTVRSDEMRFWFDEHGQVSGRHRARALGFIAPPLDCELDPLRLPLKYEKTVFERDGYKCRYCGLPVIAKQVLTAFEKVVGTDVFRTVGTNAQQHGIVHGFKVVADHVIPHKRGARTDLNNLVTSCPACNYGKECYTLEELGLDDPRDHAPKLDDWDGLTGFVARLNAIM